MVKVPTSILRICNEAPQTLVQKESLSKTSPSKSLNDPEPCSKISEHSMISSKTSENLNPLTESSEFSLSKELVGLLPENFRPKSNDEFKWKSTQTFKIFTHDNLPPYETTLMAIEGLFQIQSASLHLQFIHEDEARELLKNAYSGSSSSSDLCELFAAAAVGSQWEERVPTETINCYFNTTKAHLDDCLEEDDLRGMRILGLCSLFLMSEKRISSYSYIGNALQIGYSRGLQYTQKPENIPLKCWVGLRRLWRTLVFFESWIAASLGRIPVYSLRCNNVDLSESEKALDNQGTVKRNAIQVELLKIGILNAKILKGVFAPSTVSLSVVREFMLELEGWFDDLPDSMRLASMLGPDVSPGERTTVFTIHIMYLATIILLTRRVMVGVLGGKGSYLDGTLKDSMPYVSACISAAKQTAGILALLYAEWDGGLFKKCWLAICSSFNASVILLFSAAHKKMLGEPRISYQNDLFDAAKCIAAIEVSAEIDEVSRCYLKILAPFREAVEERDKVYSPFDRASHPPFDWRQSAVSFQDPGQYGLYGTPLPEDSEITNGLLDMIGKPYVYNQGCSDRFTSPEYKSYFDASIGVSQIYSPSSSSPRTIETPFSDFNSKTIDTPSLLEVNVCPSKKRGRQTELDDGREGICWSGNKRSRYSPRALEAFLKRVA
ncbi:uncharacterized protein LAJ45_02471 [Morchella importuna]|uniref:uncharacterized protein n=1 Tax=Morchella importuna TaxID=1174673 RepID=UPI001E8EE1D7|nr:uncharacterized protein LAJ45_02471 [Morchella importuna]KAH8153658.1 hypothetical protein LAJ45_02471 [Morchella importuna]